MTTTTTQTIAADAEACTGAQWSDLPDDLLGMIRYRLVSLRDLVRLAAVCRPWRAAASRQPAPPAVPHLLLSPDKPSMMKHMCGPDDRWVLRVPVKATNKRFVGSYDGGWVAMIHDNDLTLLNLFSGAEVAVCPLARGRGHLRKKPVAKVIFSDAPTSSSGCILAAITDDWLNIALCKVGGDGGWTTQGGAGCHHKFFADIAFYDGDLYAIKHFRKEVIKFKIGMREDGTPLIIAAHELSIQICDGPTLHDNLLLYSKYIVELDGKLLIALRTRWLPKRVPFFKVFKLADGAETVEAYQQKWTEVTSLSDYALFLGPVRSKAVHVPADAERRGLKRNHIYHSETTRLGKNDLPSEGVYWMTSLVGANIYCRVDQGIGDGIKSIGYYIIGWNNSAMWLDSPDL